MCIYIKNLSASCFLDQSFGIKMSEMNGVAPVAQLMEHEQGCFLTTAALDSDVKQSCHIKPRKAKKM